MPPFRILLWKVFKVLGPLLMILLALSLLLSWVIRDHTPSNAFIAKNDLVQIVTAVRNFYIEYERVPRITESGFCETTEANAKLMRILSGLDATENPRSIRFIEVPNARKSKGVFHSGIDPTDGAWKDRWGSFYRIRVTTDFDSVVSPYSNEGAIPALCIAWSVGEDRIQDKRNALTTGSDDIHSWH